MPKSLKVQQLTFERNVLRKALKRIQDRLTQAERKLILAQRKK